MQAAAKRCGRRAPIRRWGEVLAEPAPVPAVTLPARVTVRRARLRRPSGAPDPAGWPTCCTNACSRRLRFCLFQSLPGHPCIYRSPHARSALRQWQRRARVRAHGLGRHRRRTPRPCPGRSARGTAAGGRLGEAFLPDYRAPFVIASAGCACARTNLYKNHAIAESWAPKLRVSS